VEIRGQSLLQILLEDGGIRDCARFQKERVSWFHHWPGKRGQEEKAGIDALLGERAADDVNGVSRGGLYHSRDLGGTWESAMGHGLNTETKKADQRAYGSI
jgi:hypothetical protein